ncbi:hypothetical protein [Rhodopirellula bahusiensis]|uniref:hypothetical protein n=1 Tax=Rhodopirellula bahusiensis TaxID=2014065 RepID=UPI0032658557
MIVLPSSDANCEEQLPNTVKALDPIKFEASVGKHSVDIGPILAGKVHEFMLPICGLENASLNEASISTSCGCVAAKSFVLAGDKKCSELPFRILKTQLGRFPTVISVSTDELGMKTIVLSGEVQSAFNLNPAEITLHATEKGTKSSFPVVLHANLGSRLPEASDVRWNCDTHGITVEKIRREGDTLCMSVLIDDVKEKLFLNNDLGSIQLTFESDKEATSLLIPLKLHNSIRIFPKCISLRSGSSADYEFVLFVQFAPGSTFSEHDVEEASLALVGGKTDVHLESFSVAEVKTISKQLCRCVFKVNASEIASFENNITASLTWPQMRPVRLLLLR